MGRINNRIAHIKEVEQAMIVCIVRVYSLYSSVAKKIYNDMTAFEEKIIKVSFYSTEQSGYILSVAKSYREFSNNL